MTDKLNVVNPFYERVGRDYLARREQDKLKPKEELVIVPEVKQEENKSVEFKDGYIYVPKISSYVSKEVKHLSNSWFDLHKLLKKDEEKMLTIPQFIEFLKYIKINFKEMYKEITEAKSPWRGEYLDAYFRVKENKSCVRYNHSILSNGSASTLFEEELDTDTLTIDKGISLEGWLKNPTKQGLPVSDIASGNLFYFSPRPSRSDSVACFGALSSSIGLGCFASPDGGGSFGVRPSRIFLPEEGKK